MDPICTIQFLVESSVSKPRSGRHLAKPEVAPASKGHVRGLQGLWSFEVTSLRLLGL